MEKSVSIDAHQPVFAGHFPGRPILPGVFILAFLRGAVEEQAESNLITRSLKKIRFLKPVVPPCRLDLSGMVSRVVTEEGPRIRFEGGAAVNGESVLEGSMEYAER